MSNARNIGDSAPVINFLDNVTSDVQTQLNTLDTAIGNVSVTSGSLTKTFAADETATVTLTGNVLAPVVTATKEVAQTGVTNNAWDAAAASYTFENSAPSTTLDFVGSDISSATFVDAFSVEVQDTSPKGMAFNTDGTKMFILGSNDDDVNEYALSTGFDVSSASYTQNFDISAQELNPTGITFNTNGTKMFVVGQTGDDVNEYDLSTGFDVSTASYSQNFSVAGQDILPEDIAFNTDGTKMFIVGYYTQAIYEYTLSTGFDVSTASYSQSFSTSSQETEPQGIAFNADGTKMFVLGTQGDDVNEYALSTGFNISTASYTQNFSVSAQGTNPQQIAFNTSLTKMFILDSSTRAVNEYDTPPSTVTLGTGSFTSSDVGKCIEANSGKFVLTSSGGAITITTTPSSYAQVASGSWQMYALVYDSTADVIKLSGISEGYALANLVYDSVSGNVNQDNNPNGVAFSADGSMMYTVGAGSDAVFGYSLSTPFNPSTLTYSQSFSVASLLASPQGIFFKPDGTKFFIIDANNYNDGTQGIYAYDMSTAWDITTASYNSDYITIGGTDNAPRDVWFSSDGTLMFWAGEQAIAFQTGRIYKWTLSTAWDVSTATATQTLIVGAKEYSPMGFSLSHDGTKLMTVGHQADTINQWIMSTAYDLSTAVWQNNAQSIQTQETIPQGITFNADGTKTYIVGHYATHVLQYSTQSLTAPTGYQPAIGSTIDSTYWVDINSMTATNAVGDGNVFYALSADAKTSWNILDNTSGVRKIVKNNGGTYQVNTNSTYGSETWANAATNTEVAALREAMTSASSASNAFDISTATYSSTFSVASQDTDPTGLAFNSDGSKMYVVGNSANAIHEYALSTAFDVSTASFSHSFSTTAHTTSPSGITFKPDGTIMYVSEAYNSAILQYALSTAFNVSTATYTQTYNVSTQEADVRGVAFNSDGTKMFITGIGGDDVNEYALSTGYDISTATYTQNFSVSSQDANPQDLFFNSDGTKMWIVGDDNDSIFEYTLTTGFDVSTASYASVSFSVTSQDTSPMGAAFNSDGTKLFVVGLQNDSVYEYTVGSTDYTNQMTSTELNAINDASQITLGTALDLATIIYYASGSTTPTYSGTAINYDANVINQGAILGTDYTYDAPAQNKVRITSNNAANLKIRVV